MQKQEINGYTLKYTAPGDESNNGGECSGFDVRKTGSAEVVAYIDTHDTYTVSMNKETHIEPLDGDFTTLEAAVAAIAANS